MKSIVIAIVLHFSSGVCKEQVKEEIQFQQISIDQAFEAEKKENKLVFIDYSTLGCKPCKQIAIETFEPN